MRRLEKRKLKLQKSAREKMITEHQIELEHALLQAIYLDSPELLHEWYEKEWNANYATYKFSGSDHRIVDRKSGRACRTVLTGYRLIHLAVIYDAKKCFRYICRSKGFKIDDCTTKRVACVDQIYHHVGHPLPNDAHLNQEEEKREEGVKFKQEDQKESLECDADAAESMNAESCNVYECSENHLIGFMLAYNRTEMLEQFLSMMSLNSRNLFVNSYIRLNRNPNEDSYRDLPLYAAVRWDRVECARLLLEVGGARIYDEQSIESRQRSHWGIELVLDECKSVAMARLLLAHGASLCGKKDAVYREDSILCMKCILKNESLFAFLVHCGASITEQVVLSVLEDRYEHLAPIVRARIGSERFEEIANEPFSLFD